MACFQCDLDIPHVCYAGIPNARWGLNDSAMEALEAAQRYLNPPKPPKPERGRKPRPRRSRP